MNPLLDDYHPWNHATYLAVGCRYSARAEAVWPEVVPGAAVIWASTPWPEDKPPPDPQQSFASSSHYQFLDSDQDLWEARI